MSEDKDVALHGRGQGFSFTFTPPFPFPLSLSLLPFTFWCPSFAPSLPGEATRRVETFAPPGGAEPQTGDSFKKARTRGKTAEALRCQFSNCSIRSRRVSGVPASTAGTAWSMV